MDGIRNFLESQKNEIGGLGTRLELLEARLEELHKNLREEFSLARVSEGSHARRSVLAITIRTRLTNSALEVVTGPPGTHIGPSRLGLYTHVGAMVGSGGQVGRAVGSVTLTVGSVSSSIPEKHISEKSFSC